MCLSTNADFNDEPEENDVHIEISKILHFYIQKEQFLDIRILFININYIEH